MAKRILETSVGRVVLTFGLDVDGLDGVRGLVWASPLFAADGWEMYDEPTWDPDDSDYFFEPDPDSELAALLRDRGVPANEAEAHAAVVLAEWAARRPPLERRTRAYYDELAAAEHGPSRWRDGDTWLVVLCLAVVALAVFGAGAAIWLLISVGT